MRVVSTIFGAGRVGRGVGAGAREGDGVGVEGVEFSLVEVPGWGYYFEAEILTDEAEIEKAHKKIEETVINYNISN